MQNHRGCVNRHQNNPETQRILPRRDRIPGIEIPGYTSIYRGCFDVYSHTLYDFAARVEKKLYIVNIVC